MTSDVVPVPRTTDDIPIADAASATSRRPRSDARPTSPVPIIVEVTVGDDSSPDRVEPVPLGSTVTLSITNPDQ